MGRRSVLNRCCKPEDLPRASFCFAFPRGCGKAGGCLSERCRFLCFGFLRYNAWCRKTGSALVADKFFVALFSSVMEIRRLFYFTARITARNAIKNA